MDLTRIVFIILLTVVVGVTSDDDTYQADNGVVVDPCNRPKPCEPNTLVADPNDCSRYWQCLDFGQWVNRTCADDYGLFDRNLRRCVTGNATCQPPCKLYCERPEACLIGARVPDPFNCGRYYLCEYGNPRTWRKMDCPNGTKFDMTFMVCVTDHAAVSCHPACDLDPCDGIPRPCPKKDIRMPFLNYSTAYYECAENDGQWNVGFCDTGKIYDYKTKKCAYNGVPHPGCPTLTTAAPVPTTTEDTGDTTPGHTRPEILSHTLVQVTRDVLEGGMVNFTCRVELSQSMFGNRFTWYYDNVKIREDQGAGAKFRTSRDQDSGTTVVGSLAINPLTSSDSGTVRCNFTSVGGLNSSRARPFAVLLKPTVILSNMTATVTMGDDLEVTCTGDVTDTGAPGVEDFEINWFKNGDKLTSNDDERISKDSPKRSRLKLRNIKESNPYGCQATNKAGPSPFLLCDVTAVPKETPKCEAEKANDVQWPDTAVGKTSKELCPGNATGTTTRFCRKAGEEIAVWEEANLNNCVDPKFQEMMNQISDLKSGLGADSPEIVTSVADSLAKQTNVNSSEGGEPIKPGNLNVSVSAINDLADLHEMENAADATESEVESVVQAASNLLSADNIKSWLSVLKDDSGRAVKIMKSIDKYTSYVAQMLTANSERLEFEAANVVLTSETWTEGNLTFPNTSAEWVEEETSDFIIISNDTLSEMASAMGEKRLVVSNTCYKTLDVMLPLNMEENVPANATLVSRILSITVDELPEGFTFETPMYLEFGNTEVLKPNDTRICGFWNYSSSDSGNWSSSGCRTVFSDDNVTSCECDHMTNFAILVSRFRPSGAHMTALSTLTIIGLSLSIVCLVTTIIMYVMLWKFIKSDYALMLVNLCIALALANLIFLGGINQTEPRVLCGVVAVLLHYLFLVAFFLMLAESVELLLYIVFVFHIHTIKETAGLLVAAWGIPVIIVVICLGVTNGEGYGNKDFCWLSLDKGLIWAFLGPMIVIIGINLLILGIVIKKINDSARLRDEKKSSRMRSATWNMLVLAPLLGISWTFGLFSFNEATIAFQYVFTALNAFQGVFIFVFHCLFNKRLRDAFAEKFAVDSSSNMTSSTGGKTTSEQPTRSRKASSSTMSASKFVAADTMPAAATGYKVTRSDTVTSTVALSYDNPGIRVLHDVTTNSPDMAQNRRQTPGSSLSSEKPDIVQTLPKEMHNPTVTSGQVPNMEMTTYMGDRSGKGGGSGNQAGTKSFDNKNGVVKGEDQIASSNVRLRHDYTSYRV